MELQKSLKQKGDSEEEHGSLSDPNVSKELFLEAALNGDYKLLEDLLDKYAEKCIYANHLNRHMSRIDSNIKHDDLLIGAFTPDKYENVLHLILKRPVCGSCGRGSTTTVLTGRKSVEDIEIEHFLKYVECADVLLSKCNREVLLDLVNQQDIEGNTPLHLSLIHI